MTSALRYRFADALSSPHERIGHSSLDTGGRSASPADLPRTPLNTIRRPRCSLGLKIRNQIRQYDTRNQSASDNARPATEVVACAPFTRKHTPETTTSIVTIPRWRQNILQDNFFSAAMSHI